MKTSVQTLLSRPAAALFNKLSRRTARVAPGIALRGSAAVMALFALFGFNPQALAATDTWTGTTDNTWAGANWNPANPGAADNAVFNSAGNGNTTIDLGAGVTINNISFLTSSAAAYTIGAGGVNTDTLTLDTNNSGIAVGPYVTNNELVNAEILLANGAADNFVMLNNSPTATLTLAGKVQGGTGGTAGAENFYVEGAGNTTISGVVGNGGATSVSVIKQGAGTLDIDPSSVDGYTGTTNIQGGILEDDFTNLSSANLISSSSALSMGGGTLKIIGNGSSASSQTFASTTIASGANTITAAPGSGANNPTLTLNALTDTAGATVEFVGPATINGSGNVAATATITTTSAGAGGIGLLESNGSAYATVGLYDWATTDTTAGAAGTTIIGGSQITGTNFYTTLGAGGTVGASTLNYDVTGATAASSGGSTYSADTLRFNTNIATTFTVNSGKNWGVYGILVTPNVGLHNVTFTQSSTATGGNGLNHNNANNISIVQNNTSGELIFDSPGGMIYSSNTSSGYIQSGAGTVYLESTGGNDYLGATYLNGGVAEISSDSQLGGTLNSNTNMNGGTLVGNYTGDLDNGTHNIAADEHPVVLGNNGGGLAATAGNTLTVDGTISGGAGTGPLVIGIPASSNNGSVLGQLPGTGTGTANASVLATGVVVFSNAGNTYAGGTVLDSGTLQLASGSSLGTGAVTFNGGAFQWGIGSTADISTAGITATSLGGTIDTNGNTVTLGGVITGPGGITVTSSLANGNLKLGGASTYTGATNVAAGTLTLNSGASLGNTAITVASTLAANPGSGNIQIGSTGATLSLAAGATLDLTNGSSNTGTLTLNSTGAGLGTVLDLSGGTTASPNTLTFGIGSTGADELIVNDGVVNFAASNPQTTIKLASFAGAAPSTLLLPLLYDPNATNFSLSDFSLFAASSPITNFTGGDYVVTLTLNGTTNELFADLTQAVVNLNFYWTGAQGSTTWATIGNFATDTSGTQAQTGSLGGTSNVFETGTDAANFSGSYSPQTVGANTINSLTFTGAVASSLTLGSGTLTIDADSAFTDTNNSNNYATGIGLVVESGAAANTISANINLGASQTWEIDSANALTVSGTIAGATESLTKTGVGTLILSGSNTYAGGTTVSAGKIQLSSGGSIGSAGTLTVQGTGTFDLAGNNQTVGGLSDGGVSTGTITSSVGSATLLVNTSVPAAFSGTITDGGSGNSLSLTFAGPSTETLSGYNSYTGLTTVTGGTLIAAINSALGSSTSATGGLLLNPSSGTATVDFTSANPAIASLASSGGGTSDIVLGSTGSGGTSTTLTITGAGAGSGTTFSGVISDQTGTVATAIGNLTLSGGTLTLGGANTFTGTTIISSGGTLVLGNALALQDSTLNYNNQGGTLSLGSLTALTLAGLTGAQNLALTNTNSVAVALTIGNGVADNYTGSLSGAGSSLTKVGADTLTLSNANYTGATTVNAGSLTISGGSVGSPTSALTINVAGVGLNLTGGTLTAGTVDVGITGGATGAAVSITGAASASFASLQIGSSANTGGAFTINTTGTVSLGNYILGRDGGSGGGLDTAAGLIIDAGTVTATTIAGGSGVGGRSADINISGGTFTIGTSASTGAFELGGTGAVGSDYLTQTGGSLTYLGTDGLVAGALAGTTSGISITGATTVDTLTGVTLNSANSNTTVAALTVGTNATLYLGSVGLVENLPGLSGTGVAVNFGTAKVGAIAPWSSAAAINLTGNTTFQAADANSNPNNITLSGTLSGTGGLTVSGPGVVTLSGSNTYAGATAVSAGGTLVVSGSIGGSAATVSGAGANMEVDNVVNPGINVTGGGMLSGVGTVDGSATVSGGTLAPGLTLANSTSAVGALTSNGNVTLGSSSTFSIRIGLTDGSSGDVDSLNVPTGSFNLTDGTTTLQLNAGVAENGATLDTIYTIVNGGASLTGVSGDWFANAPGQGDEITTATGYQFDVFYAVAAGSTTDPGSDINVELIAVPEPGTWASLLGGIGILVAWQRSRRRRG